jgi:hypothetical protein
LVITPQAVQTPALFSYEIVVMVTAPRGLTNMVILENETHRDVLHRRQASVGGAPALEETEFT